MALQGTVVVNLAGFIDFRVKLAVHKDTRECVAVKMVHVDESSGLTHESLRKEVLYESLVGPILPNMLPYLVVSQASPS